MNHMLSADGIFSEKVFQHDFIQYMSVDTRENEYVKSFTLVIYRPKKPSHSPKKFIYTN